MSRFDQICEAVSVAFAFAFLGWLLASDALNAIAYPLIGVAIGLGLYAAKVIPHGFSMR